MGGGRVATDRHTELAVGARLGSGEGKRGIWAKARGGSQGSPQSGQPDVAPSFPPDGWVCRSGTSCQARPLPRQNSGASVRAAPRLESGAAAKAAGVMEKADVPELEPRRAGTRSRRVAGSEGRRVPAEGGWCRAAGSWGNGVSAGGGESCWPEEEAEGRTPSEGWGEELSRSFPDRSPSLPSALAPSPGTLRSRAGLRARRPQAGGDVPAARAQGRAPAGSASRPWPGSDPARQPPPPQR